MIGKLQKLTLKRFQLTVNRYGIPRRYHYESHDRFRDHLKTFLDAYNFAKRLKVLKGRTVYEFITEKRTSEPDRFRLHPNHLIPGPNI